MSVVGAIPRLSAPEAIAHWRSRRAEVVGATFAPKSTLTLSQWADKYRQLSADLGEPGQWRTSRVPYLREIMDAISDPRVSRVSVMKSARIGATQALDLNEIGYCVHQEPAPIIVALPTVEDARKFSSQLLQPMFSDTPVLAGKAEAQKSKKRRSTMLQMSFPGGGLQIIGTTSPRAMRMVHGRIIIKSEIDAWVGSSGDDGDPYHIIDKRADGYGNPKFIEESTPLVKESSRIEPAFLAGSQEYFLVPCPHCGEFQRLEWGGVEVNHGIKWEKHDDGSPNLDHVYYVCVNGCVIEETSKLGMIAAGEWRAKRPDRREHRSFHLNALVSPFPGARWPRLVDDFMKTEHHPEKIRTFVNTVLGETYVEQGRQADSDAVGLRREEGWWEATGAADLVEDRPVPAGAAVLGRSVDTQDDRLETAVWAWGAGEECWLIDWEILPGDPATQEPWTALDERLAKRYRHVSGRELIPRVTFIDAGGHHSKQVNSYCRSRQQRAVYSIFGATQQRAPILGKPTRNNAAKTIQYPIGVFAAKEALVTRLEKVETPGPGYIHLPPWLEDEQVHQLTAEKLIKIGEKRLFKKTRARNEMTDLWAYGLAALHKLGPKVIARLDKIAAQLLTPYTAPPVAPKAPGTTTADAPGESGEPRAVLRPRQPSRRPRRGFGGSDVSRGW